MAMKTFATRVVVLLASVVTLMLLSSCHLIEIVSWPDGQNVLANGSFEDGTQPGGPFKPSADGVMAVPAGSTTMPGWTVTGSPSSSKDIGWVQNANTHVFPNAATDGTHFLDLTGTTDIKDPAGHFGGVRQTFSTMAHTPYSLSFDIGISNPNFPGPIKVTASLGDGLNGEIFAETTCPFDSPESGPRWFTCELRFTARGANTTLRIFGAAGKQYIGLDRVSVECVAPLGRHDFCNRGSL